MKAIGIGLTVLWVGIVVALSFTVNVQWSWLLVGVALGLVVAACVVTGVEYVTCRQVQRECNQPRRVTR